MKKRLTTLLLTLTMVMSMSVSAFAAAPDFVDVPDSHWAASSIRWCADNNIVNGVGDNKFAPSDALTGAQFSVMLARTFYADDVASVKSDADNWYAAEVKTLAAAGIYDFGDFTLIENYNAELPRYQMAQMLSNIIEGSVVVDDVAKSEAMGTVVDATSSAYYADAVVRCVTAGLLNGYDDGSFHGNDTLTRAQATAVIYRLYFYIDENDIVIPEVDFDHIESVSLASTTVICASPFPADEVAEALGDAEDGAITKAEARTYAQYGRTQRSYKDSTTEICTTGEFLDMLETSLDGRFFHRSGSGFVCPTVNSWWMSDAEWDALTSDLSAPMTRGTALTMAIRIARVCATMDAVPAPDTVENFMKITNVFCPDYLTELVYPCGDAVEYWYNCGSFKPSKYTAALHEIQHEANARKSDVFIKRCANGNSWAINSYISLQDNWYFVPKTFGWVNLSFDKNIPSAAFVVRDMPLVCGQAGYGKYITGNAQSSTLGICGMLDEFSSTLTELRIGTVMASMGYEQYKTVDTNDLFAYYFWCGATLSYMDGLKSSYPDQYNKLISNSAFVNLLVGFIDYGEELMRMEPNAFVYNKAWNSYIDPVIAWGDAHESQLTYLRSLVNR